MSHGQGGPWKGKGESKGPEKSLEKAFEAAWEDAQNNGGPPGKYVMEKIEVDTENPITTYTVIITSG